jgi:hypothetical protein
VHQTGSITRLIYLDAVRTAERKNNQTTRAMHFISVTLFYVSTEPEVIIYN